MKSDAIALLKFLELCNASVQLRYVKKDEDVSTSEAFQIREAVVNSLKTGTVSYSGKSFQLTSEELEFVREANRIFQLAMKGNMACLGKMKAISKDLISKNQKKIEEFIEAKLVSPVFNEHIQFFIKASLNQ